jgi:5-formyltetrahydrofolate cyclo-ligase
VSRVQRAKQDVRERVWARLEGAGAVEPGVRGHIPDFAGSDQAAGRLAGLDVWRDAEVVTAVPDRAQYPVRVRALRAGKLLYVAVPRLALARPFYVLDPGELIVGVEEAADMGVAARVAPTVGPAVMRSLDLVVCGSVAVSRAGARLGKGAGYSDIEMAILAEAGLLSGKTTIATTVHELQVFDGDLPEEEHDFRVDLIVTPDTFVRCAPSRRPRGLGRGRLTGEQIAAIPVLQAGLASDAGEDG